MIRYIVGDFVAVLTVVAMCVAMEKSDKEKWNDRKFFLWGVVIVMVGSGLIQLLTGRNPVTAVCVAFGKICRQHSWMVAAFVFICLASGLAAHLLYKRSPRFRGWLERASLAEEQNPGSLGS
jgi:heme A synthase